MYFFAKLYCATERVKPRYWDYIIGLISYRIPAHIPTNFRLIIIYIRKFKFLLILTSNKSFSSYLIYQSCESIENVIKQSCWTFFPVAYLFPFLDISILNCKWKATLYGTEAWDNRCTYDPNDVTKYSHYERLLSVPKLFFSIQISILQ